MKILFLGVQFEPEVTGAAPLNTDLCRYLQEQGHEVTAVVGFPSYPQWEVYEGYRGRWYAEEDHDGVRVLRVWQYVPRTPTAVRRILFDTTVAITSVLAALRTRRPDVILAVSTPLQMGLSAAILGTLWRRPFVFHMQDLLPESATEVGMVNNRRVVGLIHRLADAIYSRAATVSTIGHGILDALRRRGVPEEKLAYLPNWVDLDRFPVASDEQGRAWRAQHGIGADQFVVMYIGSFGFKQDMVTVVRAAAHLTDRPDVQVVLVGDGADHPRVREVAAELDLPNLRLLPVQPRDDLPAMSAAADVFVLHQKREVVDMVVPSKLLTYGAAGKPIVLAGHPDSQGARLVSEADAGPVVEPESPRALAEAIGALHDDPAARRRCGANARRFVAANFDRSQVLPRLAEVVTTAAGAAPPRACPLAGDEAAV
ncbi:glycosyltransferase family 4 protein [Modestobacter marinus]|uniref:glycosyltransferase family 4 protein n=1 Tax=Modestobacter marinus TaxID=477641 RepID=UPI001C98A4BB|nr:glycosyltransferase family 4 protein [Modestobacter marinus]